MKNCLIFFSFLFMSMTASATDYYWVGGSGNWSEFATHWATTSGGSTFHTEVPTEFDHVYFDVNSFDATDQELLIDAEAFCNNMDWTGVTNAPLVKISGSIVLNVYGSFTLSDDMTWDHRNIDFESTNTGNTITTGPTSNLTTSAKFIFRGTGSWLLQDSLDINEINTFNGTLDLNGQYVDLFSFYLYSSSTVDLSSSEIYTVNFRNYVGVSAVVASTSTLNVSNSFYAGGSTYNDVVFSKPLNSTVFYEDDAIINTLTFTPGTNVNLEAGSTITVADLVIAGTKAEGIELYSATAGSTATISQSTGTVGGEYLTLQDIIATGGATFNATNSIDEGNNTGWTITAPTPLDYYWVGDDGNWSDYANHWATTSGSATMHTDVPGILDNVFFDASSFDALSTVTLDINANCADMDWTGLDSEVNLTTSSGEELSVHGSLTMHSMVTSSLDDLYFKSEDLAETITTSNRYLASKIWFTGTGGWVLMDSVEASSLEISSGTLDLNDQVVDLSSRFDVEGSSPKTMDFGSSTIYTTDYYYTGSGLTLNAGASTLVFQGTSSDMRGNGSGDIIYNNVVIEGTTDIDFHDHTFNALELLPGATLNIGAEDSIIVSSLTGVGTSLSPITIKSDATGTQAILKVTSGTQEVSYVELQDIHATGGATFNAYSSTDNGNNTGWNFLADVTAPSFIATYPSIGTIGGSQVSIDVQVDEPATIYSVALAMSSSAPTAAQIIAGTDASDAVVPSESLFISEANATTELLVTGLMEVESYDLYFTLKDEAENIQSTVAMLDVTTIDDTAPVFVDTYPNISVISGTTLGFSVSIQESGTVYYILLADGSTTPSSAQVKAGNDASDMAAISSGSLVAISDEVYDLEFTGLTETTAYDIYIVAEDASANLSATVELLESTTTVDPLDFYWVGGSGSWSEFATHWATTSGGATFHTVVPSEFDHVYFDANSFNAADQELLIDAEAFCNNMDWTGVTNAPLVKTGTIVLNVHGSFTLSNDMTWDHRNIDFESANPDNNITLGLTNNFTTNASLTFRGTGSWVLQDSLDVSQLSTFNGILDLNGQYVDAYSFYVYSSATVNLSSSEIHTINFRNYAAMSALTSGTSTLHVSHSFYAGGSTYHDVVFSTPASSTVSHRDDAIINTLTFTPGTNVNLESGSTITVTELVIAGTKAEGIELYTDTPSSIATISQAAGTVNGEYLILQDITVTGGATFNAANSIDNGNNTGWTITTPTPLDYYWVGDDGSWSDYANHWATTSGGSTMHTNVPGLLDNVYFDASSFDALSTITLDINANCADMDWTGLDSEVTLTQSSSEKLSIHGSLTMHAMVTSSLDDLYFNSGDLAETITTGNSYLANKIWFTGTGGWMLMDSVEASNLEIQSGTLDFNDQVVDLASRFDVGGSSPKTVDFGNSTIYTNDYYYTDSGLTLDAGTSTLVFQGNGSDMRGNASDDIIYNKVVIEGTTDIDLYNHTFNELELMPGATLNMGAEDTLRIGLLVGLGTSLSPITIISDDAGTHAILEIVSGTQEVSFVTLQDINAIGGATFNAYASTDNGNNIGWNFLKLDQTISFDVLADKTFDDIPFDLEATTTSDLEISYTSSDELVATISGSTVTIVGVGSSSISASQAGDDNYNAATVVEQLLTVNKAEQLITFDALVANTFGDAEFDLEATGGGSGSAITYVSSDETVATIAGTTVTIVGAGTTTITASQTGDDNYNAATDQQQDLVVDKADQEITFEALVAKTFGDVEFALGATGGESGSAITFVSSDVSVATIAGTTVTIVGAGVTTFTASQAGDDNYNTAVDQLQELVVDKADQTITFDELADVDISVGIVSLSASSSSELGVNFSVVSGPATISGSDLTLTGEGTVSVSASQAGNANYNEAADVVRDFNVTDASKQDQTITFETLADKTFGDAPFELAATASSALGVSYSSSDEGVATVSGSTVTIVGAGTTTIIASQTGNDSFNPATAVEQSLTVSKANQLIAFDALTAMTFGDAAFDLVATGGGSGNAITFVSSNESVATVSGTTVTIVEPGTTTITASQAGDDNYNAAEDQVQDLVVDKADQTIDFDALADVDISVGVVSLSASSSSALEVVFSLVSGPATISGSELTLTGTGTVSVSASQAGNENYNGATDVIRIFNVSDASKQDQAITFEALADKTFGDAAFELIATASSDLGVSFSSSDEGVATVSGSTVTIVGAGTTTIIASQTGDDSFNPAPVVEQPLTVNKVDQLITFDALTAKTFGDAAFDLVATGGGSENAITFASSDVSVATIIGTTVTIVGSGTTTITASQASDNNYNAAADQLQELVVNKADQTITFEELADVDISVGIVSLSASSSSELEVTFSLVSGSATISGSDLTLTGTGTISVSATQKGNGNYNGASDVVRNFNVTDASKQDQTITFEALADKAFGDTAFELVATASSGLGVSYSSSDELVATVSGSTVTIVGAGTATISASQTGDDSFNPAAVVEQLLTVNKADQVITINPIIDKESTDAAFDVTAVVDSGLDLMYEVLGPATITGTTITLDGTEGTVTVTVSQVGDVNHNETSESISFEVTKILGIGNSLSSLIKIYPNPVTEYITIDTEELVDLRFFGLNGQLIKEITQVNGKVDLCTLPNGTYLMEVFTNHERATIKVKKAN